MPNSFASDNNSGVHPQIIQALQLCNSEHVIGYGADIYTEKALHTLKRLFENDPDIFFVYGGTGANVLAISAACKPFESVICASSAHINVDECGAPERFSGCKLVDIPTINGKLTTEMIEPYLNGFGFQHHSQPKMISISQPTEMGTVYTIDELKELRSLADQYHMYIHMDGARISNAAVYLEASFHSIIEDTGMDIVSFGGNKNGLMFGEALIFFNKKLAADFKYIRKQAMQLHSKMRFIAAQYDVFIDAGIWKANAIHSNKMAHYLQNKLNSFEQIEFSQPVQTNAVFARIPKESISRIQQESFFYIWNEEQGEVRWMTAFDTTEEDVDNFVNILKKYLK